MPITATALPQDIVQAFYDSHPYPPPVNSLDSVAAAWADTARQRAEHHLFWPNLPFAAEIEILVAGCGTSQAANYALRHPQARVTGIDISQTGLRHTADLKERYGLANLTVTQLRVEDAHKLGQRFDKIVCTGVLHHLPDPAAGLAALRAVLRPEGALHLMLYATYGRTGIYLLQEYAQRLGVGTSDAEIQDFVQTLINLPEGHPIEHLLRSAPDFRRKDALADALLNPRDRAFTVPELYALLAANGMTFGRWLRQAPYLPHCGALAATPHTARLAALPTAEQHAAAELFRGTMTRHSVIAYRDDASHPLPMPAEDQAWTAYVPLLLPNTRCITERLPAGAAAVLLNSSHTYPDLYLPIDAQEKRLYHAIDGQRTLHAIAAAHGLAGPQHREQVRAFFTRLWHYDQVVFDTTRAT